MKYFLILVCSFSALAAGAQNGSVSIIPIYDTAVKGNIADDNFCVILQKVVADAQENFVATKGREQEVHGDLEVWTANMGLPGMITSSLLFGDTWRYEGVAYEGRSMHDMGACYAKYQKLLHDCLAPADWSSRSEQDTTAALSQYPKIIYAKLNDRKDKHTPGITLQAHPVPDAGIYMVTINVSQ